MKQDRQTRRKPVSLAAASLLLLCLGLSPRNAFAQNAVSTGTRAGFRMYYPNSNDWWLDPSQGRFDIRANGGSPLATLNNLGYLGIGTTSPATRLHLVTTAVQDGITLDNPTYPLVQFQRSGVDKADIGVAGSAGGFLSGSLADSFVLKSPVGAMHFGTSNLMAMTIDAGQRVGIGTTAPVARLHVNSGADNNFVIDGPQGVFVNGITVMSQNNATTAIGPLNIKGNPVVFTSANVGIGTPSPGEKLDVAGAIRAGGAAGDYAGAAAYLDFNVAQSRAQLTAGSAGGNNRNLLLRATAAGTPNANQLFLQFDGSVGIGTTSPAATLAVTGNAYLTGGFGQGAVNTDGRQIVIDHSLEPKVQFQTSGTMRAQVGISNAIISSAGSTDLVLRSETGGMVFGTSGNNERMRIQQNGNVGIGTTAPSDLLHIKGTVNPTLTIEANAAAVSTLKYVLGGVNKGYVEYDGTTSPEALNFFVGGGAAGNLTMTIKNSGNVGVGTTGPGQKLDVAGGSVRSDTGFCIGASCIASWPTGSGPAPTRTVLTSGSNATYNTPASVRQLKVRMVGGGGGGGGTHSGATAGGSGGTTSFNSITALGGGGSSPLALNTPGFGGGPGSGSASLRIVGGNGGTSIGSPVPGGSTPFGGAGQGVYHGPSGIYSNASANSGSGAGGDVCNGCSPPYSSGGGAGEYVELIINNPTSSYTYTVGAGGTAGGGTYPGGAGGSGIIIVDELY